MAKPHYERVGSAFSDWLKKEIERSGLSISELAIATGVDKRTIYRHYNGEVRPNYSIVQIYWVWSGRRMPLIDLYRMIDEEWGVLSTELDQQEERDQLPASPFADWLREQMMDTGYTTYTLSQATGVSRATVWNHANGFRNPKFSAVQKYCKLFGEDDPFKIYQMVLLNEK